jgi:hypothetical protein
VDEEESVGTEKSSSRDREPSSKLVPASESSVADNSIGNDWPSKRPSTSLFFEEILKCLTCIIGTLSSRSRRFLFNHHSHGVKGAIVALVFARDPIRNRLSALESARGIKIGALLAGMQFEGTFRALAYGIADGLEN